MKNVLFFAIVLFISACNQTKSNKDVRLIEPLEEKYGAYISSHTKGEISISDKLTVRFAKNVIEASDVGTIVDDKLYSITPKVKGTAKWIDKSTMVFTPNIMLDYDEQYILRVSLYKLYQDVPKDEELAEIGFNTRELDIKIVFNRMQYPSNVKKELTQNGRIKTNDMVDNSEIEKMLSAKFDGKNMDIEWEHISGTHHSFVIKGITRKDKEQKVNIEWKDKSYNTAFAGNYDLNVTPIGVFEISSSTINKEEKRAIKLSFTNELDKRQSLDGLIRIQDYQGKYKYDINGSQVIVYPQQKVKSPFTILVDQGIQNYDGKKLNTSYSSSLSFEPIKPAVRLLGKGVIVPYNDEIIFPFEAVNLKGATVEIFKVFNDNILQFLQSQSLNDNYSMDLVGRIIHQEEINLAALNVEQNDANFVRYALDLRSFITPDPGALYQIRIGFDRDDVDEYSCKNEEVEPAIVSKRDGFTSIMRYSNNYDGYQWDHRNNPCKPAFYNQSRFISRNVLASNIGIIAKRSKDNTVNLALSDLKSIEPIVGASITFYDFQQQEINSITSGSNGQVSTTLERKPAFAIIKNGQEFGYLNLQDRHANSLSDFDVSGKSKKDGFDGFIYGERGVWRPGDTMFLNFMLEIDKEVPSDHPISMVVKDARGKQKYTKTTTVHLDHVYHFPVPTEDSDPTGNWSATVTVGGATFQKNLKVETVKPNRLKIDYTLDEKESLKLYDNNTVSFSSKWLHGAVADQLKAKVDLQIVPINATFPNFLSYNFNDPARKIEPQPMTVFDENLDENGIGQISIEGTEDWLPPGKLKANFKTKVFEKGGSFSEDNFSVQADLYQSYVGIKIPKTRWGSKFIKSKEDVSIPMVVVDTQGNPIANRKLSVGIYHANWNWWYDRGYSDKYNYNSSKHNGAFKKERIETNSNGQANYKVKFDGYGNYMIRVCDDETGHCTGDMFYTGRSWSRKGQDGPQQLLFQTNKKVYTVGESINVKIPSNLGSKIFISIENGDEVLQAFWVDGETDETEINIPSDESMNSNIYIHTHLIQPHNHGANDLPMRMYGVVPVSVIDENSLINPEIEMAESIKPNEKYSIKIEEKNGKPMTYTIAVVDEGLLDLTRFKTPDSWNHFYSKQALGVKTWDIYDMVLDGYGGAIDRFISIGGDASSVNNKKGKKANRFVPVVTHLGPFTLEKGGQNSHELYMPNYVGSVRAMVVARNGNAYGNAEKAIPVKKPLMILATLPRVLGPNESLALPANVFAMEDKIKDVKVSVETDDNISISGNNSKTLSFSKVGDQQAYFDLKVGESTGASSVKVRAQGNGEGAFEEININVRNPNPYTSRVSEAIIEPGKSWSMDYNTFGTKNTNEAVLELSTLPPINLDKRLKYLLRYPYGCIEQTTSSVFPQLYLNEIIELSSEKETRIQHNIEAGIKRLEKFQTSNGGLGYWPGAQSVNEWGTNYAGHFLIEAKDKGYLVPEYLLNGIIQYQDKKALSTDLSPDLQNSDWRIRTQAYRLYMLAKAGRPNIGAMNRLRKIDNLNTTVAHLLAASYALIGKKDIAKSLLVNADNEVKPYVETGNTYGSDVRDLAMMAEANNLIGNKKEAAIMIKKISKSLSSQRWYSTQTTAYSLLSIGKHLQSYENDDLKYSYTSNGTTLANAQSNKPAVQDVLEIIENGKNILQVTNNSKTIMYVKFVISGQLPPGEEEPSFNRHLKLSVTYIDEKGNKIDPKSIKQGTDFMAKVSIENLRTRGRNIQELALSQIFPSGWEIQNDRLSTMSSTNDNSQYDYRDVRDDRVYTFFDIGYNTNTVNFSVNLTAAYAGRFYLSPVYVEAMYDNKIQAKNDGMWIEVVK